VDVPLGCWLEDIVALRGEAQAVVGVS
jgi:hypothetical protein